MGGVWTLKERIVINMRKVFIVFVKKITTLIQEVCHDGVRVWWLKRKYIYPLRYERYTIATDGFMSLVGWRLVKKARMPSKFSIYFEYWKAVLLNEAI